MRGKKAVALVKNAAGRGDPLQAAKEKIIKAAVEQKGFVALTKEDKKLPTTKGGRTQSVWFQKQLDGYVTSIRYGQLSIPLDESGTLGVLVGKTLDDLPPFYDAVIDAIRKGEMDAIISSLQQKRSASLTGKQKGVRRTRT